MLSPLPPSVSDHRSDYSAYVRTRLDRDWETEIEIWYSEDHHLHSMIPKMEEMAQKNDYVTREKLMRWLGFMQGVLWEHGYFTIDDLRKMNTMEQ